MRIKYVLLLSLATLCACGESSVEDRRMVNERFFGTVVSVNRTHDVNWQGVGNVAATGAGRVASSGASQFASAADRSLGTAGILSSVTGVMMSPFSSNTVGNSDVAPEKGLIYIIETEDGGRATVHASDRRIYSPGEEVMVVRNQRGYSEVFPRDLSKRYPGGL